LLEERFEEGGDAGGVHGEPGEILAGVIAEVWFRKSIFSSPSSDQLLAALMVGAGKAHSRSRLLPQR
jgi:hypothetical protein